MKRQKTRLRHPKDQMVESIIHPEVVWLSAIKRDESPFRNGPVEAAMTDLSPAGLEMNQQHEVVFDFTQLALWP